MTRAETGNYWFFLPEQFDKIMSIEHARRRYLRSDRTVGFTKVSSALSRCARCLAQKHAKKTTFTHR